MSYQSAVYGFTVGESAHHMWGCVEGRSKCRRMFRLASAWTEDVSLMLATADSLRMVEQIDRVVIERMMTAYERFMFDGAYTRTVVRRVGTSSRAIQKLQDWNTGEAARSEEKRNQAGVLQGKRGDSTHAQTVNNLACIRYVRALENNGVIESRSANCRRFTFDRGYVDAGCDVVTTESYRECCKGGRARQTRLRRLLAGERYGFEDIPVEWLEQVPAREVIDACVNRLRSVQTKVGKEGGYK